LRKKWLIGISILVLSLAAILVYRHYAWFKGNEPIAVWLEAAALVLIFGLDYLDRLDNSEQLKQLIKQADAAKTQADTSSESLNLLKAQAQEQQLRELWLVLPILDAIQSQLKYWLKLFDENRWNAVNEASRIMPVDSSTVLIQAARHSNELWAEVRAMFREITDADNQITRYYEQSQPAYRLPNLIHEARANLINAEPKLTEIIHTFEALQEAERTRHALQIKGNDVA
jgi:DNA repair exonuclease SbcCD ATPase subunit